MSIIQARAPTEAVIPKYVQPKTILSLDVPSDLNHGTFTMTLSTFLPDALLKKSRSSMGFKNPYFSHNCQKMRFLFTFPGIKSFKVCAYLAVHNQGVEEANNDYPSMGEYPSLHSGASGVVPDFPRWRIKK